MLGGSCSHSRNERLTGFPINFIGLKDDQIPVKTIRVESHSELEYKLTIPITMSNEPTILKELLCIATLKLVFLGVTSTFLQEYVIDFWLFWSCIETVAKFFLSAELIDHSDIYGKRISSPHRWFDVIHLTHLLPLRNRRLTHLTGWQCSGSRMEKSLWY
jgi:hypothetical protein